MLADALGLPKEYSELTLHPERMYVENGVVKLFRFEAAYPTELKIRLCFEAE
jgi:hypothetical protein